MGGVAWSDDGTVRVAMDLETTVKAETVCVEESAARVAVANDRPNFISAVQSKVSPPTNMTRVQGCENQ